MLHAWPVQSHPISNDEEVGEETAVEEVKETVSSQPKPEQHPVVDPILGLPLGGQLEFSALPELEASIHQDARQVVYRDELGRHVVAPPTQPASNLGLTPIFQPESSSSQQYYLPPQSMLRLRATTPLGKPVNKPSVASILMRDTVIVRGSRLLDDPGVVPQSSQPTRMVEGGSPSIRQALQRLKVEPKPATRVQR